MNHPQLIAVPVLMLADYALTILGAKLSAVVYRNHFTSPSYELNPVWRKSVDQLRWFNPRHLAAVALVTALLVLGDQIEGASDVFKFVLGVLFGAYGSVCGRHLSNLMIFLYLNRYPREISGQVRMSLKLVLRLSQFTHLGLIPLLAIVAVLVPSPYTFGVLAGILFLIVAHFFWGLRGKPAQDSVQQPIEAELVDSQP